MKLISGNTIEEEGLIYTRKTRISSGEIFGTLLSYPELQKTMLKFCIQMSDKYEGTKIYMEKI